MAGPKFTIGKKEKLKVGNSNPGAGAYNANDKLTKPKTKEAIISKSMRGELITNEQKSKVGPGQYDSPSKLGGPKYTIGEKREHSPDNFNPGPGAFNPNETLTKNRSPSAHIRGGDRADIVGREAR
jgi:hypothetical protein